MSLPVGQEDSHSTLRNFWDKPEENSSWDTNSDLNIGLPKRAAPVAPPRAPVGNEPVRPSEEVRKVRDLDRDITSVQYDIDDLLEEMLRMKGSDLHLSVGAHPAARVHGDMKQMEKFPVLTGEVVNFLVMPMLSDQQKKIFAEEQELDLAYNLVGKSRFRVNLLMQKEVVGAVMRTIPYEIKALEALGLAPLLNDFASYERGLVLITGATGSGKSTTLAAIIDKANRERSGHILTIEDPVEYVHHHKKCIVNQREVGVDTHSFAAAMKHALREDPDIILVGELRDLETISLAISLAETGHLVFGTLHTQSAPQTISRIIDVFPANQQAMIQTQLAETLKAVVCQTLVKTADGNGRQAATEIMLVNNSIKNNIKLNKIDQIESYITTGSNIGMVTMDKDLERLVRAGRIRPTDALMKAQKPDELKQALGGQNGVDRLEDRINIAQGNGNMR